MASKLTIFIIILSFLGCTKSKDKTDFIGIWESFENHHSKVVLTFYQDSLILDAYSGGFHTNSDWTYDKSKIHLKNVRIADSLIHSSMSYQYKFSTLKDTLIIKLLNENPTDYSKLIKVKKNPFTD
jgi:CobQ-like glutamine amidotransferase family enzyme